MSLQIDAKCRQHCHKTLGIEAFIRRVLEISYCKTRTVEKAELKKPGDPYLGVIFEGLLHLGELLLGHVHAARQSLDVLARSPLRPTLALLIPHDACVNTLGYWRDATLTQREQRTEECALFRGGNRSFIPTSEKGVFCSHSPEPPPGPLLVY